MSLILFFYFQLFDTLIVVLSLGVEVAFFLVHEKLLCYSPATEAATFVVAFRLWRIPRACNGMDCVFFYDFQH